VLKQIETANICLNVERDCNVGPLPDKKILEPPLTGVATDSGRWMREGE